MRQSNEVNRRYEELAKCISWGIRKALLKRNGRRKNAPKRMVEQSQQDRYSAGRNGRRHIELSWNEEEECISDAFFRLAGMLERNQPADGFAGYLSVPLDLRKCAYQCGSYALQEYVRTRAKRGAVESLSDGDEILVDNRTMKSGKKYRFARADEWETLADLVDEGQQFEEEVCDSANLSQLKVAMESLPERGNLRRVALLLATCEMGQSTIAHVLGVSESSVSRTVRAIRKKLPKSQVWRAIVRALRSTTDRPSIIASRPRVSVAPPIRARIDFATAVSSSVETDTVQWIFDQ